MDPYLNILLVVDEGEHTIGAVADACGLSEAEALHFLTTLEQSGFLLCPAGRRATDGLPAGFVVSPFGKRLLRLGTEERFRRELAEMLGGFGDHAY